MPQAEILRIIDVCAESSTESEARAPDDSEAARATIARWHDPAEEAVVLLRQPKSSLALEHAVLPERLDERLVLLREPSSAQARGFRSLWHRLLAHPDIRVIAVTSAKPGEGKTTCAANLALAMAEDAMMRVLLIDANLRRPGLGRLFGFEPAQSLIDRIGHFSELIPPYPVASIGNTGVHVAALPRAPTNGTRLERSLFSVALAELRNAYDYVVVDTASVLESADADIVGECADAVVLATRTGVSRKSDLRRAAAELSPTPIVGTVLLDA